jgi:hypothetical protein
MMRPVQADTVRRGVSNAKYFDKAIADFARNMKALAAVGDPRKSLKAFKAYIPIIHEIEDGMDAGGGLTWPYETSTGKTKASFLKGFSPEQKKADQALRSISTWWSQSGLQRITPRSEKIWNDGWNSYRKYMGERVTEDVETTEVVAEAKAPFPKPFKKGETLFAPNKSGKMVKGELVSYETGKVAGGAFTLKLTGQNESGTIVVGAEALFKANPSKMLKKEETAAADETQSLDEVQFITPKVPLKGGSNSNSKEKTDYKLYVELKDVVKDAIGILSEAELKIRNPSKNSNLSVLGTIHQANQRLKHAINFGLR